MVGEFTLESGKNTSMMSDVLCLMSQQTWYYVGMTCKHCVYIGDEGDGA